MKRTGTLALTIVGLLTVIAHPALALPTPNSEGDYPIPRDGQRGGRHVNWQVVDPDPQGLRCRMAKQFQAVTVDGIDAPRDLFVRNKHDISQWSIVTTFRRGQRLRAVTGNFANQIILVDNRGKAWLPVQMGRGNCVVRANSRFIKPIRENPTTLKPLE